MRRDDTYQVILAVCAACMLGILTVVGLGALLDAIVKLAVRS